MKKFFGVLLLFVGLFLVSLGMFGSGTTNAERNMHYSQIELLPNAKPYKETEMVMGAALVIVGFIFHVIGTVLLVTKTKKQLLMEAELTVLKNKQIP